ncbi:Ig domain-containing protein [Deinococcus sp. Marseille-Q6407]|uniref:Ig domain-containing protein n=1 Tax=Deinococcus sp. Marseille-Q6407 TaxID=2969223 RepID=UPI0021C12BF0|nr:Ig domain-containing protein [Deinococcus sp. Marseille-Q6407]
MPTLFSSPGRARRSLRLGLALLPAALLAACGDAAPTGRVYRDPLTFGRSSLPAAYQGEAYDAALDLRGGTGPYGAKLASGTLPAGLTLKNLRLAGTPTEMGTFRFSVEASDANLSSKVQEYTLNVGDLPPLKLSPELPRAEIRGRTRIPLNITGPRTARAARVTWELPEGAQVTRVQGGPSNGMLKWDQKGRTLTLDLGFKAVPRAGEQVALLYVDPAHPLTLDTKAFSFRVLDGAGKELTAPATSAPAQAASSLANSSGATASESASSLSTAAPADASGLAAEAPAAPAASGAATAPAASGTATAPAGSSPRPKWPRPGQGQAGPTEPAPQPAPATPPAVRP